MRLFIAVTLSPQMKAELLNLQKQFKEKNVRGRYSREENLHITLAFIGEYGNPKKVLDILKEISFQPFDIKLGGTGNFGSIWWAGTEKSPELEALAAKVREALAKGGVDFDRKKFSPHITLIRDAFSEDRSLPKSVKPAGVTMTVNRFSLMKSDRGPRGMIYTDLGDINSSNK